MRKRTMLTACLALALLTSGAPASPIEAETGSSVRLSLNGSPVEFSAKPRLVGSTLMVPLRDLSDALGVTVEWKEDTHTATAVKGDRSIQLTAGSATATRQGTQVLLEEAPIQAEGGKLLVPLRFFSESFDFNVYWDGLNQSVAVVDADKSLPTVGSIERMEELLEEARQNGGGMGYAAPAIRMPVAAETSKSAATAPQAAAGAVSDSVSVNEKSTAGYSATNVQVQGVDEADVIKTDGTYIYQVNRSRIIVTQAYPAESMKVLSTVEFSDPQFQPREIYVDDRHLVVIGNTHYQKTIAQPAASGGASTPAVVSDAAVEPASVIQSTEKAQAIEKIRIVPDIMVRPVLSTTKAIVYELGDRTSLKPVRETEMEGYYVTSRKIGSSLYLITNQSFYNYYAAFSAITKAEKEQALSTPSYRDSAAGDDFIKIGFEDIRYFPKSVEPNYLLVGGIHLDQPSQKMTVASYLGSGHNVYASEKHLYVTVSEAEPIAIDRKPEASGKLLAPMREMNSVIYKFGLTDGATRYEGRGKVPGQVLNQFSMDEHDGYFRIATTKGDMWRTDENTSKNNVYVLDEAMNTVGKLEDLAPGEKIYSVRYAGDRAYMVTFKQVDPLFVIDLKNPASPSVLGKLKIPGFSEYLHPYDENHVIGFGKDVEEVPVKGRSDTAQTTALVQGMKLAIFDVSDVANPKELHKEVIGVRGTYSELLQNHKALLFSKEKQLLAFPVTVYEAPDKGQAGSYGQFAFQGAYVYRLDPEHGFELRGKVTHLTEDQLLKAGNHWYPSNRNIERLLYIGDTLYSSSQSLLKANDLTTLKEIGEITLP
ncbi:beta-propeller domain-containing protein [Paenibacillus sp. GD4]|uniref:beta-propeller domain-containing protein n=1 Tax=Paenibacillus sp. GD4 TaxID=3068890 RepID=UPI0027968677|nr:beta-propeller domain-containing protein [Paenibacillus sp. GD4]MDQ1909817.1 beta-propeller domain-containing protein [Paenibacillus sp. GD4]